MTIEITVPAVGESIAEGVLARWLKPDGASVRAGDPLFELETEKATQEVTAPSDGVLSIGISEGTTVAVGSVVGRLVPGVASAAPKVVEKPAPLPPAVAAPPSRREEPIPRQPIVEVPVHRPTVPTSSERTTRERMSPIRQRIAARLVEARSTAAILTTFNEVDMSAVSAMRTRYKEAFQKKHGVGLGFMSFFVKACVEALAAFPIVNARIEGTEIVHHHDHDIGVAVSTERGLMVPIVRDCRHKSFSAIEKEIAALAQKAREGKIGVGDLQGGTFTITNGGVFGSLLSTPILNPPQSGILGMHTIQKRPVAVEDQVVIRPMMYVALSYDHRLIDGREAVGFLVKVKECIEGPERLLLEL